MYNNKRISPKKFADEVLNLPLNDYIEITSFSQFPFYSANEFLLPDNWLHYDKFYNVPLEDFMRIIDHSLANGFSLCIAYDGTLDELKSKADYLLGLDEEKNPEMTQKKRDIMFLSWQTFDDHAVHLIGTALDEKGAKFYKVKDSATPKDEEVTPFYNKEYLSENFVKSRVLFFMVNKNALPSDISVKLDFK
jgi:bleomycin hydrolase